MILTGIAIKERVLAGEIVVDPYDEKNVGQNSIDVRLGQNIGLYELAPQDGFTRRMTGVNPQGQPVEVPLRSFIDPLGPVPVNTVAIHPTEGIILYPGRLYLAHTLERVCGGPQLVPFITGRSSFARFGLRVHQTSDLGQVGFDGQWSLGLECVHPIRVLPGMRIAQIYFMETVGEVEVYAGKYQGSQGIVPSKLGADREFLPLVEQALASGKKNNGAGAARPPLRAVEALADADTPAESASASEADETPQG